MSWLVPLGGAAAVLGLAVTVGGCIDFGFEGELFDVLSADGGTSRFGGDGSGDGDGGSGLCTEGVVPASDLGPQLVYQNLSIDKRTLTIRSGDSVTWTNADSMRHSVVAGAPGASLPADRGGFNSGEFGAGEKWAYRFCARRTAVYFCSTHPGQMNGYRIVVD